MTQYQGDARWDLCPDGGNIQIEGGAVIRSGGLPGAVVISLFGGNDQDTGELNSVKQWWGNSLETDENKRIRGRTGAIIPGLAMTGPNLRRIEEAANQDLAWMVTLGVATSVAVVASIVAAEWLHLTVSVEARGVTENFIYRINWLAGLAEPERLDC